MLSILMASSVSVYAGYISVYLQDYSQVVSEVVKSDNPWGIGNSIAGSIIDATPKTQYHIEDIENTLISFNVPPQIINERTYVPIRAVAEELGYEVTWNGDEKSFILHTTLILSDSDPLYYENNKQHRNMALLLQSIENGGVQCFGKLSSTFKGASSIGYGFDNYSKMDIDIKMKIGSKKSTITATPYKRRPSDARGSFIVEHTFNVAPQIVNGSSLVPIRALSELMALNIKWNEATQRITISSSAIQD